MSTQPPDPENTLGTLRVAVIGTGVIGAAWAA
ncbi:hypothetical protein DFO66_1031, partial [Brevibacterium sanguinis]